VTDRATQFRALYQELRIRDQRGYYEDRRREYEQAHRQALVVRNVLLGLAVLAGAVSQFVPTTGRGLLGVAAGLFAALAGAVTAFETLIGFAPLTKLFQDAALNLAEAEIGWEAGTGVDAAAIERVEQVFRTESGQWGQLVIQELVQPAPAPAAGAGAGGGAGGS
jgi:hypothetical protein